MRKMCVVVLQVRALEKGMVLVVDEADKAPTHVTCILKNIIEGSEITLADGRRITHKRTYLVSLPWQAMVIKLLANSLVFAYMV